MAIIPEKPGAEAPAAFSVNKWQARSILFVTTMLYMVNYMDRQVLSVVLQPMKIDLGLTDAQAGAIQTIFLLGMAGFSFPAAFLVDRWSRRKAIFIMGVIWSAATFVTGLGRSFLTVAAPRSIVAVGEAGFTPASMAMLSAAYPERRRSIVMGIFNMAIPLGSAFGMMLGGYLSVRFNSWRAPFFIFALPGAILAASALFLKDYRTAVQADSTGKAVGFFAAAWSLMKIPSLRWLYFGYAMQNTMAIAFLTWTAPFIMRAHEVTEKRAGLLVGAMGMMALVGAFGGGWVADWWHKKNPRARMYFPAVAMVISSILFIAALHLEFKGIGFGIGLLLGMMIMSGIPAASAVTQDVVTPGLKGTSWGVNVFFMYAMGGGWAPILVGKFSDLWGGGSQGLKYALMTMVAGGILSIVFYLVGARHYPADAERVRGMSLEAE